MSAYDKAKKSTLKEAKKRTNPKSWKVIPDDKVRHVWANPDGSGETTIAPAWYADNGTPVCDDDSDFSGEDMIYIRTEIMK